MPASAYAHIPFQKKILASICMLHSGITLIIAWHASSTVQKPHRGTLSNSCGKEFCKALI